MNHSRAFGTPPSQDRFTDAGDAEADSMIGRFGRTARTRAREAAWLLLLVCLLAAPEIAAARTYTALPPPYPDGDPTADDQPSPTPKKTASVTSMTDVTTATTVRSAQASASVTNRRSTYVARMTWDLYLRLLSRLILR
jgi:hypothetical protein